MINTITLQPIALLVPNSQFVHAPLHNRPPRQLPAAEFRARYADEPRAIRVSFAADGVSNPQRVTAYGRGLDCWWIVAGEDGLNVDI
jgi:hypothetical protein